MRRGVLAWALLALGFGLAGASAHAEAQPTAVATVQPAVSPPLPAAEVQPPEAPAQKPPAPQAAAPGTAMTSPPTGSPEVALPPPATSKAAVPASAAPRPDAVEAAARTAVRDALKDALKSRPNSTISGLPETAQTSEVVRIALVMTLLVLIPAVAICMTPFVRIVVVLSMIRHAFGMPETPPNQVLISLALFLTAFTMMPTLQAVNTRALEPFLAGSISVKEAVDRGSEPVRTFMLRQVHDQDIKTIYDMSRQPLPARAADVSLVNLTPAFMLNELRVSFKIGFVIFLPFLLIDIVVASVLLSLGMLMVPPATISLPIKILMFVLIDGWGLVLQSVVGSIK